MDRRVLRERMRRKQRQIRRRKIIKLVTYVVAMVLAVIFCNKRSDFSNRKSCGRKEYWKITERAGGCR